MRTRIERLWPLLALALIAAIVLLSFPYLASAYYLEAGGRAMQTSSLAGEPSQPAIAHLNRSIAWDSANAQAYRLLAQAYRSAGDWSAAVEALTHYTDLRPGRVLGYIELAELYEEIETWIKTSDRLDLIELLLAADISTPASAIDTPYAASGDEAWRGYVSKTAFALPPELNVRPTLFMHPPAQVTYTLQLPDQPAVLDFAMGIDPQTADWPGDGVTFQVLVDGERIFFEHLDKDMARQGWHTRRVKLDPWAGREIALSLVTSAGPGADATGDWAGWGTPRVIGAQLLHWEALKPAQRALDAWQRVGYTQKEWIDWAKSAQAAGRADEALAWFQRAIAFEPEVGDAWHELGLWYQERKQWVEAIHAFEQALVIGQFRHVSASDPAYHAGRIYDSFLNPPDRHRALAYYDAALLANQFSTSTKQADCHYRRGDIMRIEGHNVEEYISAFEKAIAANAQHARAHARLGQAYYQRDGNVAAAKAQLKQAIALDPKDRWLYVFLGDLYRLEGQKERARAEYEKALRIDPDFQEVHTRLQDMGNDP